MDRNHAASAPSYYPSSQTGHPPSFNGAHPGDSHYVCWHEIRKVNKPLRLLAWCNGKLCLILLSHPYRSILVGPELTQYTCWSWCFKTTSHPQVAAKLPKAYSGPRLPTNTSSTTARTQGRHTSGIAHSQTSIILPVNLDCVLAFYTTLLGGCRLIELHNFLAAPAFELRPLVVFVAVPRVVQAP